MNAVNTQHKEQRKRRRTGRVSLVAALGLAVVIPATARAAQTLPGPDRGAADGDLSPE